MGLLPVPRVYAEPMKIGLAVIAAGLSTTSKQICVEGAGLTYVNGNYNRLSPGHYRHGDPVLGSAKIQYWAGGSDNWPAGWYLTAGRTNIYFFPTSVLDGYIEQESTNYPLPLHGWEEAWQPVCGTNRPKKLLPVPRVSET